MIARLVLLGLSMAAAWGSIAAGTAAIDYFRGWTIATDIGRWDEAGGIDDRRLAAHAAALDSLATRYPSDPRLRFQAARAHEWRAYVARYDVRHAADQLAKAVAHIEHAVRARPLWPEAWAAWLELDARPGKQWNDAYALRLDMALNLGRFDLKTQLYLVPFVFKNWKRLPERVQTRAFRFIKDTHDRRGPSRHAIDRHIRVSPDHPLKHLLRGESVIGGKPGRFGLAA